MAVSPYPDLQLGYRYGDGKLCAIEEDRTYVVRAWPVLEAALEAPRRCLSVRDAKWRPFEPEFRLVHPYRPTRRRARSEAASERGHPEEQLGFGFDLPVPPLGALPLPEQKRRAFAAFRFAIPREVARLVEPLRSHHWAVLVLLRDHPVAREVMAGNPALAFALALAKQGQQDFEAVQLPPIDPLLAGKQRDILPYCGLPGTKRAVKLLARIPPRSLYPGTVRDLARVLEDPAAMKLAAHLPKLNMGALQIIASPDCRPMVTPKLLEELLHRPREFYDPYVYGRLTLMSSPDYDLKTRRFSSVAQMEDTWQEFIERDRSPQDSEARSTDFPFPPIPGTRTIRPITTPSGLIEEGNSQKNCVALHVRSVQEGRRYIYRVDAPVRATLSIVRDPDGGWVMSELEVARYRPVPPEMEKMVRAWLKKRQR